MVGEIYDCLENRGDIGRRSVGQRFVRYEP